MIHEAIYSLYAEAVSINGNTKETISVKDANNKEISIDWNKVETKSNELQLEFVEKEKNKTIKKASAITKLKALGLDNDEISALIGE